MTNVIEIQNLSREFGAKQALDDVSLTIPQGSVFGLVGENGAGKTTIIRHILGLLKPQSGSVSVFGLNPVADPVGVLGRIGYLSEDRDLPEWMRVHKLIDYTKSFYPKWNDALAKELIDQFELDINQRIKTLSRGQLARTGLLLAVAHEPDFLLLDEPSSGLDPVVRHDILAAIIRAVAGEGRTVLFSSHLLDEVQRVADQVVMIADGRKVLDGSLDELIGGHRRVTVRFEDTLEAAPPIEGALGWTGFGREWSCLCNGEIDRVRARVNELGATIVDEAGASLEDVFVFRSRGVPSTKSS